jgi:hypothetical protein
MNDKQKAKGFDLGNGLIMDKPDYDAMNSTLKDLHEKGELQTGADDEVTFRKFFGTGNFSMTPFQAWSIGFLSVTLLALAFT